MGRYITDRTMYYYNYYSMNKNSYKLNYYEKKLRQQELDKLYSPYGGEKAYYTNSIKDWIKEEQKKIVKNDNNKIIQNHQNSD